MTSDLPRDTAFPSEEEIADLLRSPAGVSRERLLDALRRMGSFASPGLAGAISRSLPSRFSDMVSVVDFGVDPTGAEDATQKLQLAIDSVSAKQGGVLHFPVGVYTISDALRLRSGVRLVGCGSSTLIRNNRRGARYMQRGAFYAGNHHPRAFHTGGDPRGRYPRYSVAMYEPGSTHLGLADPLPSSLLHRPFFAFIVSRKASVRTATGEPVANPYYGFLTRVEARSPTALHIEDVSEYDLSGCDVCPVVGVDPSSAVPWYVLSNSVVSNLSVDADFLFARSCTYQCEFKHLELHGAVNTISANALTHTSISDVVGDFSRSFIEIKSLSYGVKLVDVRGVYRAEAQRRPYFPISIGEAARHVSLERITCVLTPEFNAAFDLMTIMDASDIRVSASNLMHFGNKPAGVISIHAGKIPGLPTRISILFNNLVSRGASAHSAIAVGGGDQTEPASEVLVFGNFLRGSGPNWLSSVKGKAMGVSQDMNSLVLSPDRQ